MPREGVSGGVPMTRSEHAWPELAPTLRAPADRSGWRRGFRGFLACAAIVAVPLNLALAQSHAFGDRWTLSAGSYTLDYSLDGPHWVGAVFVAVAVVLVPAAVLLWTARRPLLRGVGFALLALAGVGWAVGADAKVDGGRLDVLELRPVRVGASRAELRDALGPPAGYGTLTRRRGDLRLDCEIYLKVPSRAEGDTLGFCFRDDRVVKRVRW
jgi:hypothetical protein